MFGFRRAATAAALCFVTLAVLAAWHYPRNSDLVLANTAPQFRKDYVTFYEDAYKARKDGTDPGITKSYPTRSAAPGEVQLDPPQRRIKEQLQAFVHRYDLENKRVLEVGAGSGKLQDVVRDYTGLDISSSAARFFHKPFVQGSATELPFRDNSFDAVWTVFVLEHVPKPEQALSEMRRVVRDGGYVFLAPRWQVPSWAAEGYDVRPYSDFDWKGKVRKASIEVRGTKAYRMSWTAPIRMLRYLSYAGTQRPTVFRYTALTPNYTHYWESDSDAINSMDSYEAILWHESRGDTCVNFDSPLKQMLASGPVIIKVNKSGPGDGGR